MSIDNLSLLKAKIRIKEVIIEDIRELILTGQLIPDQVIHESELTKRFGTSRSPVREALIHLEQEGLVKVIPKKGTVVTKIDLDQLRQALFIRTALEMSNIQMLCHNITQPQIGQLRENVEAQRTALSVGNYSEIYKYFDEFHLLLCEFNKLPRIWEVVRTEKISLDRLHALAKTHMPRLGILYEQHIKIVDAVEQKDSVLCAELIQSHADIDYEAMNLLTKSETELVRPIKTKRIKVHNENN
jgi:DNA-binding GntR family transcriptional regulator